MQSFSVTRKKTPFQKHREEEEAKKKRAEDETARLYAEFVESFKGDNAPGSKAFVRGGTINPNERVKTDSEGGNSKDGLTAPKKGSRYVPSFIPPPLASKARDSEKKREEEKPKDKERGKSRNIDHFMEELKLEQELRERRHQEREQGREGRPSENSTPVSRFDELQDDFDPSGRLPGSFDDGDPQTTNLYVGNLSPQVDENFLLRTFGRFGPIASVKIMWPRTEEERRRQRNCGFVAFMNRADGQAAKDEMQGVVVYEYELKIGWGKSVSLPSQALPAPPPGHMAIRSKEGATVILSGPDAAPVTSVTNQSSELVLTPNVPDIMVLPPEDDHLRHVIDTMALYVLDGGCTFEQAIMERGRGNPLLNSYLNLGQKNTLIMCGGFTLLRRWRTEPFIMITGSGRWMPPPLPVVNSPEHEKESSATFAAGRNRRVDLERTLTDKQRDEFEDMLRALTLERSQIKEAMGFALDNADAAGEVVEVLTQSLTLKETAIPTKVARLMLVSDILHNSSAPERVLKVLQVWSDWFLFSDAYVNGMRATFIRSSNSGVIPFHSICGDAPDIENKASSDDLIEVNKLNQDAALAMGKNAAMKELLSLPLPELERRCRHNGLSLFGGREMMVARLLYLEEAEKQRSFDKDIDTSYGQSHSSSGKYSNTGGYKEINLTSETMESSGWNRYGDEGRSQEKDTSSAASLAPTLAILQPELKAVTTNKKENSDLILPASKWAREDDGSDDEDKKDEHGLGLGYSSSGSENAGDGTIKAGDQEGPIESSMPAMHPDNGMNEEHRQKLRRLEVAVMEYRESLEERGIRSLEEIERKVAVHRKRLQAEYGLLEPTEDKHSSQRTSQERKERRDDAHDSSRKRHRSQSPNRSPPRKSSYIRERDDNVDRDRDSNRDRDRSYDLGAERGRDREKSGSRERDDYEHDRSKERRRKGK